MALEATAEQTSYMNTKLNKHPKTKVNNTDSTARYKRIRETTKTRNSAKIYKIRNNYKDNLGKESNAMESYFTQYQIPQAYNFPVIVTEWNPLMSTLKVPNVYTSPLHNIPMTIISPQIITPLCPYKCPIISPDPLLAHVVPNIVISDVIPVGCNLYSPENEPILNNVQEAIVPTLDVESFQSNYNTHEDVLATQIAEATIDESVKEAKDLVEYYLALPKDLFPNARMLAMDPNFIIDEFCKIPDISEDVSWILDLEFGIPRAPVTRAIAVYDVKFNSIHCKNTPRAIHPGFEKCHEDFKRVLLFYYDCIVSTWYNGYIIMNYDRSVENFQSWLLIPMQMFGMCWP
ncbi:hypothetical protein KGM_213825 [Danaus plexippus plexippus]|uniref:Uncharacterized protein n=2 Tax=Danaus plexippus TaxID=13037 RepID=A0A212EHQ1_DANPL|nr:hypothetical protein KGM_213825 [Danaus plexippus plexippus]